MENANYRDLTEKDYEALVDYSNKNNERERGIWCKTDEAWTIEREQAFMDKIKERGTLFTQVNEVDGVVLTAYAGWEMDHHMVFGMGIVNPDLPDYFDVWRRDAARAMEQALLRGNIDIRFSPSSVDNELVDWLENEVGARKHPAFMSWKVRADVVQQYIDKYK